MKIAAASILALLVVLASVLLYKNGSQPTTTQQKAASATTSQLLLVNKQNPLQPRNYVPNHMVVPTVTFRGNSTDQEQLVVRVVQEPLQQMIAAANEQGVAINVQSAFRSFALQTKLYNSYVSTQGRAYAETYSAKPGYSEHQTGLAVDLGGSSNPACNLQNCFADTLEGKWLAGNAYKYGFVLRYPRGSEKITGYSYEPWHYRYVGIRDAEVMHKNGIKTLEEYLKPL